MAHQVDREVAALVLDLGGKDHGLPRGQPLPDALVEAPGLRHAAHAEALDDDGVMPGEKPVQNLPVAAWRQLEKAHLRVQGVVEPGPLQRRLADVGQQRPVPQHPQHRVVDGGEGLKALGVGLLGPGAQDDLPVEDDADPRHLRRGHPEGVLQVDLGVRGVEADGLLGPGEDDGLGAALNEVGKPRRRIGHGVRPVGQDEAVIVVIMLPDTAGHGQPMLGSDVGAVQVQDLQAVRPAELRDGGDVAQKLLRAELRRQAALRQLRGDGAAGADEQDTFHRSVLPLIVTLPLGEGSQPRSRPSRAARPKRAAWRMVSRSASVSAVSSWPRSRRRKSPRRESSSARRQRSWGSVVSSRISR